jgi:cysteinyl-tRNA synthetase
LARFWETKFFEDMTRLRVREPDTLTRVTEYVPEVVAFVECIIQNGYAYVVAGSVYFDTNKFDSSEVHAYAKLEPWSKGNKELLEEGEGRYAPIKNLRCFASEPSPRRSVELYWSQIYGRLRTLESIQTWGALLAISMGSGPSWMAY